MGCLDKLTNLGTYIILNNIIGSNEKVFFQSLVST